MLIFFLSIGLLCRSHSFLNFILGWDGLGVTSICLIMFYPNNTTLYNSFITIFFNRVGDVCLLVSLGIFLNFLSDIYIFINGSSFFFLLLILICRFTKRAQVPMSSWLPAAISAPTPISAIVHSSTLVTAGVYFIYSFYEILLGTLTLDFLVLICASTFLLGGVLSFAEADLKKIVAFSTIRQIRIIIFFCSLGFFLISLFHTFLHAIYKTFLFCCSGIYFVFFFSSQNSKALFRRNYTFFHRYIIIIRIYSMTGLIFCSSFFSKDILLETFYTVSSFNGLFIFRIGTIFTIIYCVKILGGFINFKSYSFFECKIYLFRFLLIFFLLVIFSAFFLKPTLVIFPCFLNSFDLVTINILVLIPLLFRFKPISAILILPLSIIFIKFNSYSLFQKITDSSTIYQASFSEYLIFKNSYINPIFSLIGTSANTTIIRVYSFIFFSFSFFFL